jgi:hypothetical protein
MDNAGLIVIENRVGGWNTGLVVVAARVKEYEPGKAGMPLNRQ